MVIAPYFLSAREEEIARYESPPSHSAETLMTFVLLCSILWQAKWSSDHVEPG